MVEKYCRMLLPNEQADLQRFDDQRRGGEAMRSMRPRWGLSSKVNAYQDSC